MPMRMPRVRFTVRRMMAVVAIAAGCLAALPREKEHPPRAILEPMCGYDSIGPHKENVLLGEVASVDPSGRRVEMSIGYDDGLVTGQMLWLLRGMTRGECIGQIRVLSLEPDRALGEIVADWASRRPVARVGDLVSTKLGVGVSR